MNRFNKFSSANVNEACEDKSASDRDRNDASIELIHCCINIGRYDETMGSEFCCIGRRINNEVMSYVHVHCTCTCTLRGKTIQG